MSPDTFTPDSFDTKNFNSSTFNTSNFNSSNSRSDRRIMIAAMLVLAIVMLFTTSCGLIGEEQGMEGEAASPVVAEASPYTDASTRGILADGPVEVYEMPNGADSFTLEPVTDFGTTRVVLVEEQNGNWLRVRLPMRPNHQTGWIEATNVQLEDLDLSVHVDLANRTLAIRNGAQTVLSTTVAVGTATNPTPEGTFYITDKLETPEPGGVYGPFALGLSGYSETLTEFAGGEGQIGLHGTNDPATLGTEVSHGCVRVSNEIIAELAELLPLGTPVHVA